MPKDCVKSKAQASMMAVRSDITRKQARSVIEKVFTKCYADLEPIGKRLCLESAECSEQAYDEYKRFNK